MSRRRRTRTAQKDRRIRKLHSERLEARVAPGSFLMLGAGLPFAANGNSLLAELGQDEELEREKSKIRTRLVRLF